MNRFFLVAFLISLLSMTSACTNKNTPNETVEKPIVSVETKEVAIGDLVIDRIIYGHIQSLKQIPVPIQQPGIITQLNVKNGDDVKRNERLATLKTVGGNQSIYAPEKGEVAGIKATQDTYVTQEEPFAIITDLSHLKATFFVTSKVRKLFIGKDEVTLDIEGETFKGEILSRDTLANEQGQYSITVTFENEAKTVLPGMIAKLVTKETRVTETLLVPTEAVITENNQTFVFIVQDGVANKIDVKVSESQSDVTAVNGKLTKGDQIITKGHQTLSHLTEVSAVKEGNHHETR